MAARSSIPVPSAPRAPCAPGSARRTATPTPTGIGMEAGTPAALSTAADIRSFLRGGCRFVARSCEQVDGIRLPVEPVPDPAHRHDLERRPLRELLAQPPNVHVDCLAVAGEISAPHVLEQGVAGVPPAWKREQVGEEIELPRRELDVGSIQDHPASCAVDAEIADGIQLGYRLGFVGFRLRATQHRVHAGEHLANREWLGDVVVGAKLETDDLVDLGVLGRDDDDRHAAALAKRAAEVEAAHPRQHQVEQHEVRSRGARRAQAGGAVARLLHGEPRGGEVVLQHVADALVVLDDEDAAGVAGSGPAAHPSSTTCPVSRNTMSSATLVTRSAIRSRLCATSSRVTARRALSESALPVPISEISSSNTRWYRRSISLSRPATSRACASFSSIRASRMSCTCPIARSPIRPNSARSGLSGSPTSVLVMRPMRTA